MVRLSGGISHESAIIFFSAKPVTKILPYGSTLWLANPENKKNGENRPIKADSPLIHELMQVFFKNPTCEGFLLSLRLPAYFALASFD